MVDRELNYGREIVRDFVAELEVRTAVDLGPGLGEDLASIRSQHPAARLVGLEAHPPYAAALRERGFEVVAANLERDRLPFEDQSVDLIIANQLFEHIKEVFWVLHECSRVLRVGGHLVIGTPNIAAVHNRLLLLIGRQPTQLKNWSAHVRGYTKSDLIELVDLPNPGGFVVTASAGSNFYPLPAALARPAARIWAGGAWGLFLRFEKRRAYDGGYLRWPGQLALETNFYLGPGSERPTA
ncbi:MAG TPA: class I SAM-dependent methyltransferase [Candidatus Limnocylindrales bacterium]